MENNYPQHRDTAELFITFSRGGQKGRFYKGHSPHNKGLKWDDFLSKETQEKIRKNLKHEGRPDIGGWNKKPVIAFLSNGQPVGFYSSSKEAENKTGIIARNIRKCCNKERKTAGGLIWRFDSINN